MSIEVTDEMRRAVLAELCANSGHSFDMTNTVGGTDQPNPLDNRHTNIIRARDAAKLPHIRCNRCNSVWIVIDVPGFGYDEAAAALAERLGTTPDQLRPQPRVGIELPFPEPLPGAPLAPDFGHGHGH